jgi:hypothetical protein
MRSSKEERSTFGMARTKKGKRRTVGLNLNQSFSLLLFFFFWGGGAGGILLDYFFFFFGVTLNKWHIIKKGQN